MTTSELGNLFKSHAGEHGQHKNICSERINSLRPDRYRSRVIERLLPGRYNGGQEVSVDQFWFAINVEELASKAEPEDVIDLIRCGLQYEADSNRLWMSLKPTEVSLSP